METESCSHCGELRSVDDEASSALLDLIAVVVLHVLLDQFCSCPILRKSSRRHVRMRLVSLKQLREAKNKQTKFYYLST